MIILSLPYPPSVNRYWRRYMNRTILSAHGRQYKKDVSLMCVTQKVKPYQGSVSVSILVCPPDRRRRDLDNISKGVLDSLAGYAYYDDSQIDQLILQRGDVVDGGMVKVSVAGYAGPS